jgi:cell division septal protein FtsQ
VAELTAYSGLAGINIFWVDTHKVEQALEAVPDIDSARVHCNMPADCFVEIVERQALFVWRQGDSQVWIGADGMVFPARGELPDALVLDAAGSTALRPGDRVDLTLVAAIEELARIQPEIRFYQYSEQEGLSFRNAVDWPVRLGSGEEIHAKLELLRSLTDYLTEQGFAPAFVDVRYPEAPYYGE